MHFEFEEEYLGMITTGEFSKDELEALFSLAMEGKRDHWQRHRKALDGKTVGLVFLNNSLRTRTSFYVGISTLGGTPVLLNLNAESYHLEIEDGAVMNGIAAEHVKEAARVLSRYVDLLCIRTFAHPSEGASWSDVSQDTLIKQFERYATVPIISMESMMWHPCQALADGLTLKEHFGEVKGKKYVLTWTDHPRRLCTATPNSILLMGAQLGCDVVLACPTHYELGEAVMAECKMKAQESGGSLTVVHSQEEAFRDADVIYAKSWSPPFYAGKAEEEEASKAARTSWTVTDSLMKRTDDAVFMHCLPVRRNVVVTDAVIDSPKSLVIEQAENRMHAQNALLIKTFE